MTQYTITSWFIIKSGAPPRGHLLGGLVTRHEKTTPLLCRTSGPFHGLSSTAPLFFLSPSLPLPLSLSPLPQGLEAQG